MATLLFQGHASCRIVTAGGVVIYIDPFVGEGYDLPADIVLVTHEHGDHNDISKVLQKPGCRVIRAADALTDGQYHSFDIKDIHIRAVPAGNKNHNVKQCVGFILTVDGVSVYHAGDTSTMPFMDELAAMELNWALLPVDGVYNMEPIEASACAELIGARHTIPIHTDPSYQFNRAQAEKLNCSGRCILEHGESVEL